MTWTEEPLDLDLPDPVPKKARHEDAGKITWSRYRSPNAVHCDDCLAEIHESWPNGTHAPNRAMWRRKVGARVTFMCSIHGQAQREKDGVLRGVRKARRDL